jgi:hypothetical protein
MTPSPPAQVCQLCGHDDFVSLVPDGSSDEWLFVCSGHEQPWNWSVRIPTGNPGREGITAELGLYEDLPLCILPGEPWVEHGVVEYRYSHLRPEIYTRELLPRFGHTKQGPRHFSTSALIAKALGQLRGEGLLAWRYDRATGFWGYNGQISYWAQLPAPADDALLTWAAFAELKGLDPDDWDLNPF